MKKCAGRSVAIANQLVLVLGFSFACALTSHSAKASLPQTFIEIVAQQAQPPAQSSPATPANQPTILDINTAKSLALNNIAATLSEVKRLREANQTFSISFIVTGITLTLIATSLGAVESQNAEVKKWTKFAIVGLGAAAVAAQSLNAAFPVTKKAAEFADIYWNLLSLQNEISNATTVTELAQLSSQYSEILKRAGKAESNLDQPKKN